MLFDNDNPGKRRIGVPGLWCGPGLVCEVTHFECVSNCSTNVPTFIPTAQITIPLQIAP